MRVEKTVISPTSVKLSIVGDPGELSKLKNHVIEKMAPNIKVAGFRSGKAPLSVIEKQLDPQLLQAEFVEDAINHMYRDAVNEQKLRPVSPPQISLKKFVPFATLEFEAEIEVIGDIKLPNYKTVKVSKPAVNVSAADVEAVLERLQTQLAEKKDVQRASKEGDQVWIDFKGTDAKGEPVSGGSGKDYPLVLGSNTFIPGFEPNLVGLKTGEQKSFTVTFPKDYSVTTLQGQKVNFDVTVNKVQEVAKPKLDETFAAKVGPFKSIIELKNDIKKQLQLEREREANQAYENSLVLAIADKATIQIPPALIDEQVQSMEEEEKRNLTYRGQTWQEHLDEEKQTEDEHRANKRPEAERRVKAGLALSEIAELENIDVTPEELEIRIQILKGQYQDQAMQAELEKPENRRDIAARLMTEKTIARLVELNK